MDRRTIVVLAAGHLATDLNQGAMPALLPFFVAEYQLSNQQAAGLVFAATVASSVVQPIFGRYADRFPAAWLMPAGVLLAGLGLALTGLAGDYWLMLLVLAVSGLGVAAFHPEAARRVNAAAGASKAASMSLFSLGGSAGFAVGPLLATGLMLWLGVRGAVLLIVPAVAMTLVLANQLRALSGHRPAAAAAATAPAPGQARAARPDAWRAFGLLTVAVMCRSIIFYGLNTFLPLYWVNVLGQSPSAGSSAASVYLGVGLLGTVAGGRLADRLGRRRLGLAGSLLLAPLLAAFALVPSLPVAAALLPALGVVLFAPGSAMVVIGQGLLPNHVGVASGVTIGLAVSVGGGVAPALGWVADHYGLPVVLGGLAVLPLVTAGLLALLPRQAEEA